MIRRPLAPVLGLWVLAALGLSELTGRVTDWFDMTDELRYERLAISIARTGSVLPRIHETSVRDIDQLYPMLIAPFFAHGTVAFDLHQAHILNAWVMTSACIPAYLLGRRVTGRAWVGWVIAVASLTIPWLIYSSFLLTEVVAYPVFLWAFLAVQRTVAAPTVAADLFALVAVAVSFFARTEFAGLIVVLPLAVVVAEVTSTSTDRWRTRVVSASSRVVRGHPVLVATYGFLLASALVFTVAGGSVLGLSAYGQSVQGALVPAGFMDALLGYVAQFAFGLAILPFVVGFAWLLANTVASSGAAEARAFACVGSLSFVVVFAEVTKYALGVGGVIYERFTFYFVPIVLLAFVCALLDRQWPRWSLLVPFLLVAAGFVLRPQSAFTWNGGRLNPDTPVSIFYHPLVEVLGSKAAMQAGLVLAAIVLTGLFAVAAARTTKRKRVAAILITATVSLLVAETGYVFVRLFRTTSYSERPLTAQISPDLAWVDGVVGHDTDVTAIPYHVSTDYFVSLRYWRDLEFWNKSVDRDAQFGDPAGYDYTGVWFPKLGLTFDPATGRASISPSRLVVQSVTDTRFQLAGTVQSENQFGKLIDADQPWRLSYLTRGAYDDGWLMPGRPATIRLFPSPGQRGSRIHYLNLQIWAPRDVASRPYEVRSNLRRLRRVASNSRTEYVNALPVCVPANGYADVRIAARGASAIPADLSTLPGPTQERIGSIFLADASVSDDLGGPCEARPST